MSREDPLVLYLVVRKSLGMSVGKVAAQAGHAVRMVMTTGSNEDYLAWLTDEDHTTVVLGADDKEFEKVKALPGAQVVTDRGYTEIAAGSQTVIGLPPMRKSAAPSLVRRLRVLQ